MDWWMDLSMGQKHFCEPTTSHHKYAICVKKSVHWSPRTCAQWSVLSAITMIAVAYQASDRGVLTTVHCGFTQLHAKSDCCELQRFLVPFGNS
jgi:hypothetical protein